MDQKLNIMLFFSTFYQESINEHSVVTSGYTEQLIKIIYFCVLTDHTNGSS